MADPGLPRHDWAMVGLTFDAALARGMSICRYGIYLSLLALIALQAWVDNASLSDGIVYFVLAPAAVHTLGRCRPARTRRFQIWMHRVEVAVLAFVLTSIGTGWSVICAALFLCALANVLLWGLRVLPGMLLLTGMACVGALVFREGWAVSIPEPAVVSTRDAAWALACLGAVVICGLSHRYARALLFGRRALQLEKRVLERYLPREVIDHAASGDRRVERRWLTVAFIDLVGFTQATRALPAETLSSVLNDFFAAVNEHVVRHDGSVSKFLGDGVLCVFNPDDVGGRTPAACRCVACLSALPELMDALHRRWRSAGYLHGFGLTSGVASGFCALGDWGSDQRLDYTVIGEPVNLARRLQTSAGDCGGMLIDAVTAELVRPFGDVGREHHLQLKGLEATVGFAPLPMASNLC